VGGTRGRPSRGAGRRGRRRGPAACKQRRDAVATPRGRGRAWSGSGVERMRWWRRPGEVPLGGERTGSEGGRRAKPHWSAWAVGPSAIR
jgi:hypothetical protein